MGVACCNKSSPSQKNTGIYRVFENPAIFNRDTLERGWQEAVNISGQKAKIQYTGDDVTLDELWNKFYSKPPSRPDSLSPQNEPQKATKGEENTGVPETHVNTRISAPKEPQIEEIGEPIHTSGLLSLPDKKLKTMLRTLRTLSILRLGGGG